MTDNTKLKKKIAALIAKADGTDNANEAEVFMKKAQELLEKHQIETHELEGLDDPMCHEKSAMEATKALRWHVGLFTALARYYGCSCWFTTYGDGRREVHVAGRESARTTLNVMWPYIKSAVYKSAIASEHETGRMRKQIAHALSIRLDELRWARESRKRGDGQTGLMVLDAAKAYKDSVTGDLKPARSGRKSLSIEAIQAAESIGLNEQVGGKSGRPLRITS